MKKKKDKHLVFGIWPVIEAIKSGQQPDKLLLQKGLKSNALPDLLQLAKKLNVPHQFVPAEKLNRITRKNHQGVICFLSPVSFHSVEDILPMIYEKGEMPFLLVLDRITDVRNFGAIVRTAECAGVHAIVIPEKGAARIGGDATKTSAGALFNIPICKEPSLSKTIDFLQKSGIIIAACTEKGAQHYDHVNFSGPVAIVMGSEEDGISNSIIKKADYLVKIPLLGKTDSLNVSVATGVILFDVVRQRIASEE